MVIGGVAVEHVQPVLETLSSSTHDEHRAQLLWFYLGSNAGPVAQLVRAHP